MYMFTFLAMMLAAFGIGLYSTNSIEMFQLRQSSYTSGIAKNMIITHQAAVRYSLANPATFGVINNSDLNIGNSSQIANWEHQRLVDGVVITLLPEQILEDRNLLSDNILNSVVDQLEGFYGVGYVEGGQIVSDFHEANVIISAPGSMEGKLAIATMVRDN